MPSSCGAYRKIAFLNSSIGMRLDKEFFDFGFGVKELNIIAINYPEDVQKMAKKKWQRSPLCKMSVVIRAISPFSFTH